MGRASVCRLCLFPLFTFSVYLCGEEWAEKTLSQMNLEEKVGQLFVVPACELRGEEHQQDLESLIRTYHVGGVIPKQGTLDGQVKLINRLQSLSQLPLICVVDAEWGLQMRMEEVLPFPRNLTLGAIQDLSLLYQLGQEIGRQCSLVGGHINAAPVVDVNTNPRNPIIHMRSFGQDPVAVANRGFQVMRGIQSKGILACAKHFPGHGDVMVDSHSDLPQVAQPRDRLERMELLPFRKMIEGGVEAVMSAHVQFPALDSQKGLPATFSRLVIRDLLFSQMGFKGLVISDALNMQAIERYYGDDKAAELAFKAGHDLLLYGDHIAPKIDRILREQVPKAFHHLVSLFRSGELDEKELDSHVLKILQVKEALNLQRERYVSDSSPLFGKINTPEAKALKRLLFREAVTVLRNQNRLLPLKKGQRRVLYFQQGNLNDFRDRLGREVELKEENGQNRDFQQYSLAIFALSDLSLSEDQFGIQPAILEAIGRCQKEGIPVLIALMSTPYSLAALPLADGVVVAYEKDPDAQESAAEVILGKVQPRGKLPVSIDPAYPLGSGIEW
jgi:beta-glucosidase-like glycosyl hydrolase